MLAPTAASSLFLAADGSVVNAKTSSFVISAYYLSLATCEPENLIKVCLCSFQTLQQETNVNL
jgi:hypothetical protein